jgi:nucleolar protein 56
MAGRVAERLRETDSDHRFEHHSYPGAGHAITVPYQPVTGRETTPFLPGVEMALGGTPGGYAEADADSWPRVLDVLDEGLR